MSFQITIQTLKNAKHPLTVNGDDKVSELKQRIEDELKLGPADRQKLIVSGKVLKDDQTLSAAKVKPDDFVVIMITKKKKKKKKSTSEAKTSTTTSTTPTNPATTTSNASDNAAPSTPATTSSTTTAADDNAAGAGGSDDTSDPNAESKSNTTIDQAASGLAMGNELQETIANLMNLGFSHDEVTRALRAAFNNADRAAEYLFNGIPANLQQPAGGASAGAGAGAGANAGAGGAGGSAQAAAMAAAMAGAGGAGAGAGGAGAGGAPNAAQMQAFQQMISQNPQMLQGLLAQMAQQDPQMIQAIQQNPQAFLQMMGALSQGGMPGMGAGGAGGPGVPQGPPGTTTITITAEEKQAIDNLTNLGFDRQAALQAYLICDKNEELAANYLFDHAGDNMDTDG